jgi:sec-independent protein translocase protein TatA
VGGHASSSVAPPRSSRAPPRGYHRAPEALLIDVSPIQLLLVLAIALIVLGPRRLPRLGRDLGRGLRAFRDGLIAHEEPDPDPARPEPAGEWTDPEPPPGRDVPREPEGPA